MLRTIALAMGVPGPVVASDVRRTGERNRSGRRMSPMTEHPLVWPMGTAKLSSPPICANSRDLA
jgi:hypothetical protein